MQLIKDRCWFAVPLQKSWHGCLSLGGGVEGVMVPKRITRCCPLTSAGNVPLKKHTAKYTLAQDSSDNMPYNTKKDMLLCPESILYTHCVYMRYTLQTG